MNDQLVTFAVIAYNQEQYIREAVESALAQTYSPLQIILSDDCSTDDTFKIMCEMVADYTGKHTITLNKNAVNLGNSNHVNTVEDMAEGDLIVWAAGDDISLPKRVEKIVAMRTQNPGAVAFWSQVVKIDEYGNEMGQLYPQHVTPNIENFIRGNQMVLGASLAFTKAISAYFGKLSPVIKNEDILISFRAALLGGCIYLPEPLVQYRIHSGSYSQHDNHCSNVHFSKFKYIQRSIPSLLQAYIDLQLYCNKKSDIDLTAYYFKISNLLMSEIDKKLLYCLIYSKLLDSDFIRHCIYVINSRPATLISIFKLACNKLFKRFNV